MVYDTEKVKVKRNVRIDEFIRCSLRLELCVMTAVDGEIFDTNLQVRQISHAEHVFFYSESKPHIGISLLQLSWFCAKYEILLIITPI